MAWPDDFSDDDQLDISGNPVRNDLVARLDKIYDVLKAIRNELGANPSGAFASVASRLDAADLALTTGFEAQDDALGSAITAHTDSGDPHAGKYGKIISPLTPDGGGTVYGGGTPANVGPDHEVWVDESA